MIRRGGAWGGEGGTGISRWQAHARTHTHNRHTHTLALTFAVAARCACGGLLPGRGDFDAISIRQLQSRMLLRRFTLSHNRSLDGVVGQLSNRDLTEAGPAEMLDLDDDDDERSADHAAARLPGVQRKGAQPCARPFRHGWAGDWNLTSPGAVLRAMAESEGLWV